MGLAQYCGCWPTPNYTIRTFPLYNWGLINVMLGCLEFTYAKFINDMFNGWRNNVGHVFMLSSVL